MISNSGIDRRDAFEEIHAEFSVRCSVFQYVRCSTLRANETDRRRSWTLCK